MAKKKMTPKKCSKKCGSKKSCTKKVETFDNRLSTKETIKVTNNQPGLFNQIYNYFFPAR